MKEMVENLNFSKIYQNDTSLLLKQEKCFQKSLWKPNWLKWIDLINYILNHTYQYILFLYYVLNHLNFLPQFARKQFNDVVLVLGKTYWLCFVVHGTLKSITSILRHSALIEALFKASNCGRGELRPKGN